MCVCIDRDLELVGGVYKFFHLLCCLDGQLQGHHIPSLFQMRPDIESKLKEAMQSITPNAMEEVHWKIFPHS